MRWTLLVVLLVLTSGCFGSDPKALSQEEAETVAEEALQDFAKNFASATGGDLTKVEGEFSVSQGSAEKAEFTMEWGRNGAARVALTGSGIEILLVCDADSTVLVFGGQAIESRPRPGAACLDSIQDSGDPLDVGEFENLDALNVTPHPDGTVTAVFQDDEGTIIVKIDAKGRISRMDIDSDSGDGFLVMSYGERRTITVPDADERMPASINGFGSHSGTVYRWEGFGGDEHQPFNEFEVRVIDAQSRSTVATFPMGQNGEQAGFTFTFQDDGDGQFDGGDSFTISHPDWASTNQYDVVVWDRWADRELGDAPIPGLGALAVVGLLGAVWLRRR